jgi:hypothetical protein
VVVCRECGGCGGGGGGGHGRERDRWRERQGGFGCYLLGAVSRCWAMLISPDVGPYLGFEWFVFGLKDLKFMGFKIVALSNQAKRLIGFFFLFCIEIT